ncbi:type I-E CRISPR-associated protein Cas5/CasD [Streptomyces ipomoeae]|uniref:type I-E CRISPR-associated protein Cas5/CasD n=1 Tax=Streptomyces ipomoeae TaxID=103232 RepID=UPI0029AF6A75|nr:type I-E CRISPR-associated protein Cas5/CasD [Streptomyces ipomoeae]MDX2821577.1 type I-E CRISPR-associated protein Cas5/CasD [Streptomyces ipomoeae]MDX2879617.1 type I-E CRISPR-associated protein Cas5/CasD [Streptomyces ipomoeae]
MSGLLLRLAAPLQSWGERSAFTPDRDTAPFPTRSALIGMFAAAEGIPRHDTGALDRYSALEFTVRVDRPGTRLVDYHTVGGGQPKEKTAATSGGSNKGAAVITRRHYLADAVFVIAVTGPADTITRIAHALHQPHWSPYLGRRSCVPDEPLLLRTHAPDPVDDLLHHVPLSWDTTRTTPSDGTLPVTFLWERPPAQPTSGTDALTVQDMPRSFDPHGRGHDRRRVYRTVEHLPAHLAARPHALHEKLIDYATKEVPA